MKNLLKYILLFSIPFLSAGCSSDDDVSESRIPPVMTLFYQNADALAKTYDPSGKVSPSLRNEIFDLYKQGNWTSLEALFKNNNLNGGWSPANGGYNIIDNIPFSAGQKFDRYSGAVGSYSGTGTPILGGSFTSPIVDGYRYTFSQRALNMPEKSYDFYYEIDVMNNLLPFKGQLADVSPWFGQVGGGTQMMWKIPIDPMTGYQKTWNKLAQEGYIKVTIIKSPSGKYNNLSGTVIQK
ncbi:glycohydrolase toxin TNT-related protein [uncultured Chryseobacterium sp.]|uniref:glycohydrolase toxin TNT-related protein n=1 Tax=uncultured Chryseobacterium sp. TaxID=259322 RepID=UPI0025ED68EF|nr:glycohydrolase toxin TNT-related protein [uncultured Chryseobacterium sp.]